MILLIGGTSDTAPIATGLANAGFRILVSTATDIPLDTGSHPRIARRCGFLDASGWSALIREHGFELVVDAAHPFATGVHALIRQEASKAGVPCIAYERPAGGYAGKTGVIRTTGHDKAAAIACRLGKPILLTTGTKDLLPYVRESRRTGAFLIVRVLPHPPSIEACLVAGIPRHCIVAARGPFSVTDNREIIRRFGAGVLITKDSGPSGGVPEKMLAARRESCIIVLIERPQPATGATFDSIPRLIDFIAERC